LPDLPEYIPVLSFGYFFKKSFNVDPVTQKTPDFGYA